ncbi:MAG: ribonuclease P protein component [Chloroflexi bacterium]|nr:ribonuclease P protein component [Chloroflexota bacterium]
MAMRRGHRLRRNADFQRVRAARRSWGHPLLVLYVAPNEGGLTRLGISVGKRVGTAVVRNRVKRRVREAVRAHLAELAPAHDLVFIARPSSAAATWDDMRTATEDLLRRARILPRTRVPSDSRSVPGSPGEARRVRPLPGTA